jgi:OOP family OmpA-OmpF porin
MKPIRFSIVIVAASLLGACAGNSSEDWKISEVEALPQHGSPFKQALHRNYLVLSKEEEAVKHYGNMWYFNGKARRAAAAETVLPTKMTERKIPDRNVKELTDTRARLIGILNDGGREKAPNESAHAQAMFDCWMEEQGGYKDPADIARCRNGFQVAFDQTSNILYASAAPAPMAAAPYVAPTAAPAAAQTASVYTIYFAHDSSEIDAAANVVGGNIVDRIRSTNAKTMLINGYTDRSGSREYNRKLAERRAASVATEILSSGVNTVTTSQSFGEDRPVVKSGNGTREWHNRRVLITIE